MPRFNVEYKGGWACFSGITDSFITEFMDKAEYEEWRRFEYGEAAYKPAEECNVMTMKDAVHSITLNRPRENAVRCLLEAGFQEEECEQLMFDCETEYNCPRLQDDGSYECPNCSAIVIEGQKECEDETCCIRLVWR